MKTEDHKTEFPLISARRREKGENNVMSLGKSLKGGSWDWKYITICWKKY
jgi:hypothetical protein